MAEQAAVGHLQVLRRRGKANQCAVVYIASTRFQSVLVLNEGLLAKVRSASAWAERLLSLLLDHFMTQSYLSPVFAVRSRTNSGICTILSRCSTFESSFVVHLARRRIRGFFKALVCRCVKLNLESASCMEPLWIELSDSAVARTCHTALQLLIEGPWPFQKADGRLGVCTYLLLCQFD